MVELVPLSGCHWCERTEPITHGTYVRIALEDGRVVECCDDCWEKGNEGEPDDD